MAHEVALNEVNQLQSQLAQIARAIVDDFKDGKVTPIEGFQLGMQGMALASHLLQIFQGLDKDTRQDILFVLEHGHWNLPEGV